MHFAFMTLFSIKSYHLVLQILDKLIMKKYIIPDNKNNSFEANCFIAQRLFPFI